MSRRIWEQYLTDQDRAHLAAIGEQPPFGFGENLAVLCIDNYRSAVGDRALPLLESIQKWPSSTGLAGWEALDNIRKLLEIARAASIPIIHVTGLSVEESGVEYCGRGEHDGAPASRGMLDYDIVPQAAPEPGEVLLRKSAPSAFFGTPLVAHLTAIGIDTLIVCGESTSGCVRASVVDARSYRYRVTVVEDCVYDRHEASHAVNLFDMHQKYADVVDLESVASRLRPYSSDRENNISG